MSKHFKTTYNNYAKAREKALTEFRSYYKAGEYVRFQKGNMLIPAWGEIIYVSDLSFEFRIINLNTNVERDIGYYDLLSGSKNGSIKKPT